ncbi:MAG: sulfide:quinone oxidoreductase [Solirubrobacterales bacterium]|jgi:sulfide:quinone oxidoreductase|nr:sulfide:quinone oxidoreductase [Solirubrobacterales bacterium]
MTDDTQATAPLRVLIAGGGVTGLEALLALRELAGDRVAVTLVAPQPEFVYRPMIVEEAFSHVPAERHELDLLVADRGGQFVLGELNEVVPDEHLVRLADGAELEYDAAIICIGAPAVPAYESATTLRSWDEPLAIDEALAAAASHSSGTIAFVVPPGVSWPLPLYELAMLAQPRAADQGLDVKTLIVTPESEPLAIFGPPATDVVAGMLRGRHIEVKCGASVVGVDGEYVTLPDNEPLDVGAVVALPVLTGPGVSGLPSDGDGFIPTDEHGQVRGVQDVFAAGDGTDFPIKQGGLGTQQADACAEMIASRAGADLAPQPFRPMLRGKLITKSESLSLTADIAGGGGPSTVSPNVLWRPSQKIAGRYLSPYLSGAKFGFETQQLDGSLEIEVSLPTEWHGQPVGWDSK